MPPGGEVELATRRGTEVELFSLAGHDGHLREVNSAFALLLGRTPAEINGRSILELVDPVDVGQVVAGLAALEAGSDEVLFECRFRQNDGSHVHLQWVARTLPGTDTWWAAGRDTTDFHRLLAERLDMRARLDLALGHAGAAMWELDVTQQLLTWEPEAAAILGVAADALPATAAELAASVHPQDAATLLNAFEQLLQAGTTSAAVRVGDDALLRHLSLRGKVLSRDRRGRPTRAVGVVLDVTTEKAMEEQMLRMVMTDSLTGIANRRAFDKALRSEWRRSTRAREPISVVIVDIDHFKHFNDTFGHLVGDAALVAVARAMAAPLHREGDLLARFGGEEFAVVLPGSDAAGAQTVAQRLMDAVHGITLRQADDASLTVSVGTASWDPDSPMGKADELLGQADEALYAAKAGGRDRVIAYESSLAARATLEGAIARGLENREFELHYQPIVALDTGEVVALEALMRWNRPGHGLEPPATFIPVAEGSGLICDLDRWALHEATGQLVRWSDELPGKLGDVRAAVNVSGRHAASASLVEDVAAALAGSGLAPGRLELELTETTLAADAIVGLHLAAVRHLGVRVALDDFGTGSTSIAQISRLPADVLKIDRSFVASTEPGHQKLVAFVVEAAHTFGLGVVAEGVEEPETLEGLRVMGCDTAQGYLIARPMPADRVVPWLRERRAAGAGPDRQPVALR